MRRHLLWLALAVVPSACSPPHRGTLEPIQDAGVELVSTHGLPNDTARLSAGGVIADVTGRWSDQGESVEIRYRSGNASAQVAVTSAAASSWNGRRAPATAAWDRSAPEPGNAIGRPLLDADAVQLSSSKPAVVQIEFGRTTGNDRPSIGDEVTITIPMPGSPRATRFRVSGE